MRGKLNVIQIGSEPLSTLGIVKGIILDLKSPLALVGHLVNSPMPLLR